MKTIILILFLSFNLFAQSQLLTLFDSGVSYEAETLEYQTRVLADGGSVINLVKTNQAIAYAKANGTWDSVYCWVGKDYGVKKNSNNKITKLYTLKGAIDLEQADTSKSPTWYADSIYYDGGDFLQKAYTFPIAIPQSPYCFFIVFSTYYLGESAHYLLDGGTPVDDLINFTLSNRYSNAIIWTPTAYAFDITTANNTVVPYNVQLTFGRNNLENSLLRLDGVSDNQTELGIIANSNQLAGLTLGASKGGTLGFQGQLNEFKFFYNLSVTNYALDETFFNNKYTIYTVTPTDTIPSQFTFADVTDAALSSYNQAYIVVAGCDSARFYPASGDSLKLGVLGTYDVDPIWADVGDSIYVPNVASASNGTATHSIIYSSNGTPLDTFSVTTVAGGGASYTTDSLRLVFDDEDLANGSVGSWTDQLESFALNVVTDTTNRAIMTAGGLVFGTSDGYYSAITSDPFPLITDAISIEVVVNLADTTTASAQVIFGIKCPSEMMLTLSNNYTSESEGALHAYGYDYGDAGGQQIAVNSVQGSLVHIIATFDGVSTTKIYINGVESTVLNNSGGSTPGGDGIALGQAGGTAFLNSGSIIRYAAIYAKVLTAQEVEDNYNSDTIQGKLP